MGIDVKQAKSKRLFENLAKDMLRYLEDSEDVKVGITELQEQLEVPVQIGTILKQVAQQARNDISKGFCNLLARRRVTKSQLGKVGCAVERFGGAGKKVSGHKSGNTNAEQKGRNI